MKFSLGCQLQQALESYFSSILEPDLLEVLQQHQESSNPLKKLCPLLAFVTSRTKREIFLLQNLHHFDDFSDKYVKVQENQKKTKHKWSACGN